MGNEQTSLKVQIWHKFSSEPPRGWPQNGCLFFTINTGSNINDLLREINTHRRPEYQIKCLLNIHGNPLHGTDIIRSSDFYV